VQQTVQNDLDGAAGDKGLMPPAGSKRAPDQTHYRQRTSKGRDLSTRSVQDHFLLIMGGCSGFIDGPLAGQQGGGVMNSSFQWSPGGAAMQLGCTVACVER
jgi:hypothetical protein